MAGTSMPRYISENGTMEGEPHNCLHGYQYSSPEDSGKPGLAHDFKAEIYTSLALTCEEQPGCSLGGYPSARDIQRIKSSERGNPADEPRREAPPSGLPGRPRIDSVIRPHRCDTCGKSFRTKSHLSTHEIIHTGQKPFQCFECGKSFNNMSSCKRHQRVHNGQAPTQIIVHRQFDSDEKQRRYPANDSFLKDPVPKTHWCETCGKSFRTKSHLSAHKIIHTGQKPYQCFQCGRSFNNQSSCKRHQRMHTGEKPLKSQGRRRACSKKGDGEGFSRAHSRPLAAAGPSGSLSGGHQQQQKPTVVKPYWCITCGKTFRMKSHLTTHAIIHTGEKPFRCFQCGKCFNNMSSCKRHERMHTGQMPSERSPTPALPLNRKTDLDNNSRIHSRNLPGPSTQGEEDHQLKGTSMKPYWCNTCGKSFRTKSHLATHEIIHTGEKPFQCFQCGKAFNNMSSCKRHQKIHTDGKTHPPSAAFGINYGYSLPLSIPLDLDGGGKSVTNLSLFDKDLYRNQDLLLQQQKVPPKEKPYKCAACGKRFRCRSNLIWHESTHSRQKRHSCSHCGMCFALVAHLKRHYRIHGGERPRDPLVVTEGGEGRAEDEHYRINVGERPRDPLVVAQGEDGRTEEGHYRINVGERPREPSVVAAQGDEGRAEDGHYRINVGERPHEPSVTQGEEGRAQEGQHSGSLLLNGHF